MSEPIHLTEDHISIVKNEYGTFVQMWFCDETTHKAEQLKEQILNNQKIAERVKLEHDKFARWGFDGLQEKGKSQLHLLSFCLDGKLPHEMRYNFCIRHCGRRTDTKDKICRMCKGLDN